MDTRAAFDRTYEMVTETEISNKNSAGDLCNGIPPPPQERSPVGSPGDLPPPPPSQSIIRISSHEVANTVDMIDATTTPNNSDVEKKETIVSLHDGAVKYTVTPSIDKGEQRWADWGRKGYYP